LRIGILGGTFDPIHFGHIATADAAMECAQLDRVLFIPSAQPPHRAGAVAPAAERLEMCKLAVNGREAFEVSDVEMRRGGPSYTSDTLAELKRTHPQDELSLILGWDAAKLFATWHETEKVKELASFVVVSRPGMPAPGADELTGAGLDPARVMLCLRPTPDISGSALRRAIARGESIAEKVPEPVALYIAEHHLYMDNR
jgi:nicotinate-nucleotide adenylyltransferase